eukprot:symbB.v1.2.003881.t2/scaffold211.1/size373615/22
MVFFYGRFRIAWYEHSIVASTLQCSEHLLQAQRLSRWLRKLPESHRGWIVVADEALSIWQQRFVHTGRRYSLLSPLCISKVGAKEGFKFRMTPGTKWCGDGGWTHVDFFAVLRSGTNIPEEKRVPICISYNSKGYYYRFENTVHGCAGKHKPTGTQWTHAHTVYTSRDATGTAYCVGMKEACFAWLQAQVCGDGFRHSFGFRAMHDDYTSPLAPCCILTALRSELGSKEIPLQRFAMGKECGASSEWRIMYKLVLLHRHSGRLILHFACDWLCNMPSKPGRSMAFGRKDFGLPRFLFLFAILIWQVNAQVNLEADLRPPEAQEPEAAEACDPTDAELRKRISIKRHAAAVVAGFADGAMAQLPMATAVVPMIQAAMVFAIAQEYGCYLDLGTAVAVVTMLSSDYVKMSLVSHAVGWIPFAGNMVKMGLSVVMTEGIGLAAENLLGCPTSRQNLLEQAAREEQNENLSDEKKAGVFREHFHAIADFLSNTTLSDTSEAAREAWRRVESLFRQEDQVALLGKVHEARSPQELLSLVQTYKWNLKVVEASLEALRDRYPVRRLACTDIDVVATKLWASKAADGEVKAVVGPHLLHCWHLLSKDLQEDAAQVAQELAIEATRLGAGKGSAAVLPGSLALLLVALQKGGVGNFTPRLPLLDGLMKATQKEVDACHVLREVFRREAFAELVGSWVQVRHVQQLDAGGINGPAARFEWSAGDWFVNDSIQRGLRTSTPLRHYAASARFQKFSNRGKDLVLQFSVKHENEDLSLCAGGYVKLLHHDFDQSTFGGTAPYQIMFGPDICGYDVSVIHLIFNWKGRLLHRNPEISLDFDERDSKSHIYTLLLSPDNTYKIYIDLREKSSGKLHDFWDFPKMTIDDPTDRKPKDWIEHRRIVDPEVKKPEDWVEDQLVPDPFASKPLEWDDEEDGPFVAPLVENPLYKGSWFPAKVDNPEFRGEWKPRQRGNPEYEEEVYAYSDLGAIGLELWTVHEGSIFDNILICDSWEYAKGEAMKLQEILVKEPEARRKWKEAHELDQMEAPQGAEMCLPGLLADIKQRLTLPTLPPGVELPSVTEVSPKAFNHAFAGLVGQNCAVKRLVQSPGNVRLRKKGIQRPGVPLVLLMTGPSGTGKTMAARKIAEYIHGRPIQELLATGRFKLFPMNQFRMEEDLKTFFGPPRGIQGSGDLPDLVRANPDAVIVLDEIEKAHRSFAKALLTVFGEYGTVYDPRSGRDYSASNITFVLTSNLAKDAVLKHPVAVAKRLGRSLENNQPLPKGIDADPECMAYAELREMVEEEISKSQDNFFFRESEIRGRLTDTLPFLPFGPYEVQEAVRSFLTSEAQVFAESRHFANLELAWTEDVVVFFANLYVRKPDEGLRAVNKQLQSQVRDLLERAVDVGLVQPSATVVLRMVTPTGGATAMDLRVVPKEPQAPKLQSSSIEAEPLDTPKVAAEQDVPMFFPSLATAFANLGSTFETPRESSVSSGEWEWQADWEWQSDLEWLHNWDWQQLWEHMLLFLYKWRFPLAVTGFCLFAVMTAGAATPVAAPMAAAAAVPAAAPTITAGTTAMAVVSWAMALVQVAGGSASVAVPAMTFFWAWKNKVYIEAAIFAAISLALVPWALRIYRTTYSLLYSTTGFTSWKSSKKTRHMALKTKAQVPRTPQRALQTRELPGPNPETPEKNPDEEFMELSPMEVTPAEPSRPHTPSSVSGDGAREASASPRSSERAQGMDEDEPLAIEQ